MKQIYDDFSCNCKNNSVCAISIISGKIFFIYALYMTVKQDLERGEIAWRPSCMINCMKTIVLY